MGERCRAVQDVSRRAARSRNSGPGVLHDLAIRFVEIGAREFEIASEAFARFGKGRHPAALNMGDCFAYACAKANKASLLFIGDDFTKTDIARC